MLPPSKPQIEVCLTPTTLAGLLNIFRLNIFDADFVLFKDSLNSSQLTSEKKPCFGSSNESLPIPVIAPRLR
jgi:hypothetical protein